MMRIISTAILVLICCLSAGCDRAAAAPAAATAPATQSVFDGEGAATQPERQAREDEVGGLTPGAEFKKLIAAYPSDNLPKEGEAAGSVRKTAFANWQAKNVAGKAFSVEGTWKQPNPRPNDFLMSMGAEPADVSWGVTCVFPKSAADSLAGFKNGEVVKVTGKIKGVAATAMDDGRLSIYVVIQDCSVVRK
jgi:hypothetical protein